MATAMGSRSTLVHVHQQFLDGSLTDGLAEVDVLHPGWSDHLQVGQHQQQPAESVLKGRSELEEDEKDEHD